MKRVTLVLILLLVNYFGCFAQFHTVSGFVVSAKTGERLISATFLECDTLLTFRLQEESLIIGTVQPYL